MAPHRTTGPWTIDDRLLVWLAVAAAVIAGMLFAARELSTEDLGYHLDYGNQLLATGHPVDHDADLYTLPAPDMPAAQRPTPGPGCWYDDAGRYRFPNANWLTQGLIAVAYQVGGVPALNAQLIVLVAGLLVAGCAPAASRGNFDSANPAAKAYAIEQAIRDADHSAIPDLVEQLDNDDPLIRFMAIAALESLTGRTLGYVHYAPAVERREAIGRWVQFVLDDTPDDADDARRIQAHGG